MIDPSQAHQKMDGFGATHYPLIYTPGDNRLSSSLRAQALDAVYKQVQLTTGYIALPLYETPATATDLWNSRRNDNADPLAINESGFNFRLHDEIKTRFLDPAIARGFDDFYLGLTINVRWASPWMKTIRSADYNRYLDETAEQIAAGALHWRDKNGISPRHIQLFNEPTNGNRELDGGTAQEVRDIVKRVGARLRSLGFADVKFVVPGDGSEQRSLEVAKVILADPDARQYVGAIAYHPYPYGSTYAAVPNILNTSGQGNPDPQKVAVRNQLRDLGKQYGIPLWMTEVSHAEVPALSFANLLGRAIHVHDELVYADAAAYFGMGNMWDSQTHREHYGDRNTDLFSEDSTIALIETEKQKVHITGMGYAIGHYARWVKRGAVRIGAASDDPLVQVTAFKDEARKRFSLVLINNKTAAAPVQVKWSGLGNTQPFTFTGERSTAGTFWTPLAAFPSDTPTAMTLTLPAKSVTSLGADLPAGIEPGDVSRDGSVDVGDAVLILRNVVGLAVLDSGQAALADMDGDEIVTVTDAVRVLQKAVQSG